MNTLPPETALETGLSARIVIIGGGITGLSAAWYLQKEATSRKLNLGYTVLEGSPRWGGKVYTEHIHSTGDAPFILEAGADAFLTRKPWAWELAQELGLQQRILPVNSENNRTFVLHRGQPVALPEGLHLLAPTKLLPFLRSPLFSPWGKLRALLDMFIPPRRTPDDETLADFVRRRLGGELLDKLGEPLLAGVYNNDPECQSMQATFPQFPALEAEHGSLIRGLRTQRQPPGAAALPPFISFMTGAQELITALITNLTGELRLNNPVSYVERLQNNRFHVVSTQGESLEADALIITTPATVTAQLLREAAPQAAKHLDSIPYNSVGTAYFAFRNEDVQGPLKGLGLLVPRSEKRSIDGITWTSSKWRFRAPDDCVLLRVFFGGPRTQHIMQLDDVHLLSVLLRELRSIFSITASPLFHRIYRWQDAYPQYNLGHHERVAAAEAALPAGIFIAGSAYHGVGVPDCVRQGRDAARNLVKLLMQTATTTAR